MIFSLENLKTEHSVARGAYLQAKHVYSISCYHGDGGQVYSIRRPRLNIQRYPEVTMAGKRSGKVYELDLHGKKLTKIEGLEKVG